jgi:hypothetical protein
MKLITILNECSVSSSSFNECSVNKNVVCNNEAENTFA